MLLNNRILKKLTGTVSDLSVKLNNIHSGTEVIAFTATDYLYIGSDLPFNHRYFDVSVVNAVTASASVALWNGTSWVSAVDVIDQTSVSGKSLAQSGIISWVPDKNEVWTLEDTTEDITDLSTQKIYDFYWVRIGFGATITAGTALKYVGHKFATDEELGGIYPELIKSSVKTAFQAGKTLWTEQLVEASEIIVRDLRKKGIVWSRNQIVDWAQFTEACVHKTAQIIFVAFGEGEQKRADNARAAYKEAMNQQVFNVDKSEDGRLDPCEKVIETGVFRR